MEERNMSDQNTTLNNLFLDREEYQAAQYIPDHEGHCVFIHGHTYSLWEGRIGVKKDAFLDFGLIKKHLKEKFDHVFFVPARYVEEWQKVNFSPMHCQLKIYPVPGDNTVEEIVWCFVREIRSLDPENIVHVKLRITEGNHQGAEVDWWKSE
jgi:6-pyruvoyl-tetrahydropterin synthase